MKKTAFIKFKQPAPPKSPSLRGTDTTSRSKGGVFQNGFTLIELLVVIVIIGILATIGIAQFNEYQEKARLAKAISFAKQSETKLLTLTAAAEKPTPARVAFNEGSGTTSAVLGTDYAFAWSSGTWSNETYNEQANGSSIHTNEIEITSAYPLNMTDGYTVSFWTKLDSFAGDEEKFFSYNCPSNIDRFAWHNTNDTFFFYSSTANTVNFGKPASGSMQSDKWYHIMFTTNGTTIKVYVDGDKIAETTVADVSACNSTASWSMSHGGGSSTGIVGHFDDFGIYPVFYE